MPFIIIMQQQPGMDMQAVMQSQQAWIMRAQVSSPLVQVMVQPMSAISILHMPIVPMLNMQHIMPLHMQHMEHMPPCIIMHMFCIIMAAVLSSQVIMQRMPPWIFSIFIVQRGIIMPGIVPDIIPIPGIAPAMGMPIMFIPPMPIPGMPGMADMFIMPGIMEGIMFMPPIIPFIMGIPIMGMFIMGMFIMPGIMPIMGIIPGMAEEPDIEPPIIIPRSVVIALMRSSFEPEADQPVDFVA